MFLFQTDQSERQLSQKLGVSRSTLRKAKAGGPNINLAILQKIANYFQRTLEIISYPENHIPSSSTVAVSISIERDGFDSWKIHLMDLVDEFRATKDERLLLLPPLKSCEHRIRALLAATVMELCFEAEMTPPDWAVLLRPLERPLFLSGIESLKASALLESPYGFRSKNIFVLANVLDRA